MNRMPCRTMLGLALAAMAVFGCERRPEPADTGTGAPAAMRIVSMAPNLTEILFALGLDAEIVGVTTFSTYPAPAAAKKKIGSFWQPDIEAILMLRPTLVVTLGFDQQTAAAARLETIGCRTLTVNIESLDDLYRAVDAIGAAVGRPAQARQLLAQLTAARQAVADRADPSRRPKVLWVIQRQPLRVAGRGTFINELIDIAGGVNAIEATGNRYPPVSAETVIKAMPEVIIEPADIPADLARQQASAAAYYQRFAVTPAVRDGRIHVMDGDVVSRLGPRLDQALTQIADCLWPPEDR